MERIQVFLITEDILLRTALRTLINEQEDMRVVGEARSAHEAWKRIVDSRQCQPDLLILDLLLSPREDAEAIRRVQQGYPHLHLLVLAHPDDKEYLHRVLLERTRSCLVAQEATAHEWLTAIRTLGNSADHLAEPPRVPREMQVLRLVALGWSHRQIAAHLAIHAKSVERHRVAAMRKLEIQNHSDLMRYAHAQGWL